MFFEKKWKFIPLCKKSSVCLSEEDVIGQFYIKQLVLCVFIVFILLLFFSDT